ncbi:hypothetical protein CONPUDRAFT_141602 [Coniophora puteana RWD-64-598 SS2]|uniref:Uncharacterized protein n=1 Tax=Coniophora puteana (strain RWD-64-598) TaxID=741705 RepID=A0A5M3MZV8_CONPW|nr:uncharacterized protein CONPUDRAFT_141602 [Coniophora puteana RWD-64-598 SS2]EIW84693.1 hypothetical protein CONPUDRAFT_141602 [Coniophora puteana RWD-64-598 SS2]
MPHILSMTPTTISPSLMLPSSSYSSSSTASTSTNPPATPPPTPPSHLHKLHRRRSPSPIQNPFHSRPYTPTTPLNDITRILDPAYAPASAKTLTYTQQYAYVDGRGELHDPDYRDFRLPTAHSQKYNQRYSHPFGDDGDEEEEEDEGSWEVGRRRSSEINQRRDRLLSGYDTPLYNYEPTTAYEERGRPQETKESTRSWVRRRSAELTRNYREQPARAVTFEDDEYDLPAEDGEVEGQDEGALEHTENENEKLDGDFTPTCTHSLRRQWHAVMLGLRFTVFRTKRRIRRRLSG